MRSTIFAATALAAVVALSGCGSDSLSNDDGKKGGEVGSVSVDKEAAALVPKAIKDKGTITIGTDASYAPSEFLAGDGETVQGFDVDLFNAVAKKLDLKTKWQPASFDTIITGVQSDKFDVGVSSFTVNPDRMKQANMISYFNAGTQWATVSGDPKGIDVAKPCGLTIAVQKGTVQEETDLPPKEKQCRKAGKPIKVLVYDKQDQATAAVVNGKADGMLADSPVVAYAVQQSKGKLEAVGDIYDAAPYGYVVSKKNTDFGKAIVKALQSLQSEGGYEKALKGWGVEAGAIDNFELNPKL